MKKFQTTLSMSEAAELTGASVLDLERSMWGEADVRLPNGCKLTMVENGTGAYSMTHEAVVTEALVSDLDADLALLRGIGAPVIALTERHELWWHDVTVESIHDAHSKWREREFYQWDSNTAHIDAYLDTLSPEAYAEYLDNLWEGNNAAA